MSDLTDDDDVALARTQDALAQERTLRSQTERRGYRLFDLCRKGGAPEDPRPSATCSSRRTAASGAWGARA